MPEALQHNIIATEEQITQRVKEQAAKINSDYAEKTLDVICLINSALFFSVDLVRQLTIPIRFHLLGFANYPQGNETGEIRITLDVSESLFGCHILVVEGIVVSGRTPRYILDLLSHRKPASLAMCTLGIKPAQLSEKLPLSYVAFELGNEIAVGYGVGSGVEKTLPYLVEK